MNNSPERTMSTNNPKFSVLPDFQPAVAQLSYRQAPVQGISTNFTSSRVYDLHRAEADTAPVLPGPHLQESLCIFMEKALHLQKAFQTATN